MISTPYLFNNWHLKDFLDSRKRDLLSSIDNEKLEYLASVDQKEYLDYKNSEFEIQVPTIDEDNIEIDQHEQRVERHNEFYTRIGYVDGVVMHVLIPYDGDKKLLQSRPNTYTTMFPQAGINDQYIVIEIGLSMSEIETCDMHQIIQQQIDLIKTYLSYASKDIAEFNSSIKTIAKERMDYQINKYKKICKMNATLPYKIQRYPEAQETYKVPTVVKKIALTKPESHQRKNIPEPSLELNEYDNIIEICSNMSTVMERSPSDFAKMKEETIRSHFLVQLNSQYQGQATGETFNSNGKTDILIRNENQNVFIAECKFWKGKNGYLSTIDQLLGYVTYRDTKTAVFMFVKNKKFTEIFNQMKEVIEEHPNFVKFIESYTPPKGSSAFRCEFKNQNDDEKHFYITIMAFCIPTEN